ncbi:hypothetical protein YDYSG_17080 [Paenibacillus tyrfis]|nr:hypothetical protein YDYSG_17080 [Paenibacillus tyrfis]GMX67143.1 hypothetical protein Elgi_64160 [Paenibacillus elgii]
MPGKPSSSKYRSFHSRARKRPRRLVEAVLRIAGEEWGWGDKVLKHIPPWGRNEPEAFTFRRLRIVVVDPIIREGTSHGNVPFFLGMTKKDKDPQKRKKPRKRVMTGFIAMG